MLRQTSALQSTSVQAADGVIGKVCDLYFDPYTWMAQYLVVDVTGTLQTHYALISPSAVASVDWLAQVVQLSLERAVIEASPTMDTPWPLYWSDDALPRGSSGTHEDPICLLLRQRPDECDPITIASLRASGRTQPSLHSAATLAALQAYGVDGSLGNVIDLFYDENTWTLRYLLLDTMILVPDSHLMISTQWVEKVSTPLGRVFFFLSRAAVRTELLTQLGFEASLAAEDSAPKQTNGHIDGWHRS